MPSVRRGVWGLCLGKFTAHVRHAAQKGHTGLSFKIIIYTVAVRLDRPVKVPGLGTGYGSGPRTFVIIEIQPMGVGGGVEELPGVALAALARDIGCAPGHFINLQTVP